MFKKKDNVIVVGDLHFPYEDKKALKWALKVIKKEQPTHVVQIGDLYDFYWTSSYPKKFIELSPEEEVDKGYEKACAFWESVQIAVPEARCYQLIGNHDERPFKRILEKAPELQPFFKGWGLFQFLCVQTQKDARTELDLKINGRLVRFIHGNLSKLGAHMLHNQMCVAVGHSHKGGVVYRGRDKDIIWEMNAGYLADNNSGPFQYGPQSKKFATLGLGQIDAYGPRFIPFK